MADTVVAASLTLDSKSAVQSVASFREELKKAQLEVIKTTDKFGATSKEALQAAKNAAILKDRIGDAKKLVDSFNPDEKFRGFTQVLTGVAGGFSAITGAMGLLGVQSEDVQKQLLKVQSALAITQGLNSIGDSIQSFKNLGATLVQTLGKSGLIGVAIAGVVGLTIALVELFKGTEKQTLAQKQLNDVNKEAAKDAVKERVELDLLVHAAKDVNRSVADRLAKVKELQDKFPGYFEDIKTEKDLNDKLTVAYDAATKGILAKAHATAVFNKIVENENKILELQEEKQRKINDALKEGSTGAGAFGAEETAKERQALADTEGKIIDLKIKELRDASAALEQSASILGKTTDEAKAAAAKAAADSAAALKSLGEAKAAAAKAFAEAKAQFDKDTDVRAGQITGRVTIDPLQAGKSPEQITAENEAKVKHDLRIQEQIDLEQHTKFKASITAIDLAQSQERIAQEQLEYENKQKLASATSSILGSLSQLVGQQTAAGKVLAIAQATIDTYAAAVAILKNTARTPAGGLPGFAIAQMVATIVAGLLTVKKIIAVKVPGAAGSGGGVPSASAPLIPQAQVSTTSLDQNSLNAVGNATTRAYVVESDVSSNQEKISRLNRAARLGG